MAIRLTKNFTLAELCASDTAKAKGIKNEPGTQEIINLTALATKVLQPLRSWWGQEVKIGSGYRCPKLNAAVGGVSNSQHMKGQAADLCIDGNMTKGKKWFNYIRDYLEFDQLIWEHNAKGTYWIHVSFCNDGTNRKQVINNLLKKQ